MTITEFVDQTREQWVNMDRSHRGGGGDLLNWHFILQNAGYPCVEYPDISSLTWQNRAKVYNWCNENFGEDRWSTTGGGRFYWFEKQEDAMVFKLRWS